jgi:hypothetical protein
MEQTPRTSKERWTGAAMIRLFQRVPPGGQQAGLPTTIGEDYTLPTGRVKKEICYAAAPSKPARRRTRRGR